MESTALYSTRAELYDAIYHFKDYGAEAERIHALLEARGVGERSSVLDAACGTGSHLAPLRPWYEVSGFDLSEAMLEVARRKLPGVSLFAADLKSFTVERPVDGLLCLFSSIAYLRSRDELLSAARSFAAALRPGGVLLLEPFVAPADFVSGRPFLQTFDGEDLKCARVSISHVEGDRAVIDFGWLVVRRGQPAIEHFVERHDLWLCPYETITECLEQAGFTVEHAPHGLMTDRGLLIACRS